MTQPKADPTDEDWLKKQQLHKPSILQCTYIIFRTTWYSCFVGWIALVGLLYSLGRFQYYQYFFSYQSTFGIIANTLLLHKKKFTAYQRMILGSTMIHLDDDCGVALPVSHVHHLFPLCQERKEKTKTKNRCCRQKKIKRNRGLELLVGHGPFTLAKKQSGQKRPKCHGLFHSGFFFIDAIATVKVRQPLVLPSEGDGLIKYSKTSPQT